MAPCMALRVVDYHACLPVINKPWISGDFLKRPSSAPTPTDARKRPQVQSKTEDDQFTLLLNDYEHSDWPMRSHAIRVLPMSR